MKTIKYFILFTLHFLGMTLLAQENNSTQKSDKEIYKAAVIDFKSLRYEEAYKKFDQLFYNHLGNQNINFYLGRSAFEINQYELSMSAFERILMVDPNNTRTKLELARVYFMMKMYESSELEFREILKTERLPQEVKDKVNYYLYLIENSRKKSFTTTVFVLGFGQDSNTNSGSLEETLDIAGNSFPNGNRPIADTFNQALVSVSNIYDVGNKDGFLIKNNFLVLEKSHFSQKDKNILFFSYSPTLSYKASQSVFDLTFGSDYLVFGQKAYTGSYYFSPKYSFINSGWLASLYYKQRFNRYTKVENQNRNSTVYEIAYSMSKSFKTDTMFSTQFLFQKEQASSSAGDNLDVNRHVEGINILLTQTLPLDITIKLQAQARATQYLQENIDQTKRADTYLNYVGTLSYKIDATTFIDLQYNDASNSSNQDPYTYKKNIIMSNLTYIF